MRKEALPEGSPVMQNVRVGERLGVKYTGAGSKFNLASEFQKSATLEAPTFEAIYKRVHRGGADLLTRILPTGEVRTLIYYISLDKALVLQEGKVEDMFDDGFLKLHEEIDPKKRDEILVIPNFAFQTADMVNSLPESTLDQDYNRLNSQIPVPEPSL